MESRDDLDLAQTAALAPTPGEQNIGRGAENSLKRKERLKALREQRKRKLADGKYREIENEETEAVIASDGTEDQLKSGGKPIVGGNKLGGSVSLPKPVFRTYRPADDWLKKFELPDSQPENIDQQVKENLAVVAADNILDRDINISTLQSHKPDWDLKRGIAKQLDKLERRTKRAIAELVRERLQANKDINVALAQAISKVQPQSVEDSDDD